MQQENELMRMKRKSGKSWRDLERETGIPSSTIRNHMEGRVRPNPEIVDALTDAMQPSAGPWHTPVNSGTPAPVSPQDIPQAPHGVEMVPASTLAATRELYERQLASTVELYESQIASLKAQLAKAEARIRRLTIALALCVIFFTLLMVLDILNRDVGWFRGSLGFAASVRPAFRLAWCRL